MGNCLTKTKVSRKSQNSQELRLKDKSRGQKDAKRQATGEISGRPDTSIATETVNEGKAESNEDCEVAASYSCTRQITKTNETGETGSGVLVHFYSRLEDSEVNEPELLDDHIPFQEPVRNDTENDEENDAVHIIEVTGTDIDKNSASINTPVCAVSEKLGVREEDDDVNKVDEVGPTSLKRDFITETGDVRSYSKEEETNVIDTDPTTLLELSGSSSNRKCHDYTSTENDRKIGDKLRDETNNTCTDLANNLNDIHTEGWNLCASTVADQIDSVMTSEKPPSCVVTNNTKLREAVEESRIDGHNTEVSSVNEDIDLENFEVDREDYIKINPATKDFAENSKECLTEATEKAIEIKITDLLNIMFGDPATESARKRRTVNASGRYALAESKYANTESMAEKQRSESPLKKITSKALTKAIRSLPKFMHRLSTIPSRQCVRNTTACKQFEIKELESSRIDERVSDSMPSYTTESITKSVLYVSDEMETKVINTLRESLKKIELHRSNSDCKVSVFVHSPYADCEPRKIQVRASSKQIKTGVAKSFVKASTYVIKSPICTDPPDDASENRNQYTKKTSGLVLAEGAETLRFVQKPGISEVKRTNPTMFYEHQWKGSELDRNSTFKKMNMDIVTKQFPGVLPVHVQKRLQKTQRKNQQVEIV